MKGLIALYTVLADDPAVTDLVGENLQAGALPQDVVLPAISLQDVSGVDLQLLQPCDRTFTVDRIQATVLAKNWDELEAVMSALRSAAVVDYPVIDGLENVVIRTDAQGPYFTNEEASIHLKTQDFKVSYSQPA